MPRVSVVLTVYRRTQYLAEAIESVRQQSFRDWDLVVADDSGTSAAAPIVDAYQSDPRVRYLANPTSLGVAASLVRAGGQTRAPLVAILNDDDVWETDLLRRLVLPLEADPRRVLATADHWIMDAAGNVNEGRSDAWTQSFGRDRLPEGDVASPAEFAIAGGPAVNIAAVFRRDAIDWSLVVPEVVGAYDYWIGCLLAATGRPIYYVPARLARWREHSATETRRRSHDKAENLVYIYSTLRARGWFAELGPVLDAKLAEALFAVGRDKLHFNRAAEARRHLWQSFRLSGDLRALSRTVETLLPRRLRSRLRAGRAALRGERRAVSR